MRRIVFLLTLIILVSVSCKNKKSGKLNDNGLWDTTYSSFYVEPDTTVKQNFVDTVLKFRAWFPQKPETETDSVKTREFNLIYHTFLNNFNDSVFVISVVTYPRNTIDTADHARMLLSAHQIAIDRQNLISDFEYLDTVNYPFPVLFYKAHQPAMYFTGMNLIYENRMYQVFVVNSGRFPSQKSVNRFLGNFQIIAN